MRGGGVLSFCIVGRCLGTLVGWLVSGISCIAVTDIMDRFFDGCSSRSTGPFLLGYTLGPSDGTFFGV